MFFELLNTLRSEKPFFHTPLEMDFCKTLKCDAEEYHIVNGQASYWESCLIIKAEELTEKKKSNYYEPFIQPHFSISLSLWDNNNKTMTFMLAVCEKQIWDIREITTDDFEVVQFYELNCFDNNKSKITIDDTDKKNIFLKNKIMPIIRENFSSGF
jgi:hypothetical protein